MNSVVTALKLDVRDLTIPFFRLNSRLHLLLNKNVLTEADILFSEVYSFESEMEAEEIEGTRPSNL